jgi:hypothetical protein
MNAAAENTLAQRSQSVSRVMTVPLIKYCVISVIWINEPLFTRESLSHSHPILTPIYRFAPRWRRTVLSTLDSSAVVACVVRDEGWHSLRILPCDSSREQDAYRVNARLFEAQISQVATCQRIRR